MSDFSPYHPKSGSHSGGEPTTAPNMGDVWFCSATGEDMVLSSEYRVDLIAGALRREPGRWAFVGRVVPVDHPGIAAARVAFGAVMSDWNPGMATYDETLPLADLLAILEHEMTASGVPVEREAPEPLNVGPDVSGDGSNRIFFDTEFMEDGAAQTVKLLSVGMVASNGAALYLVIKDAPREEANDFVVEHVLPYLDVRPPESESTTYVRCARSAAGRIITEWVAEQTPSPEMWAWYADYDWVGLCQLFGSMVDLPEGWPMFCRDLRQEDPASFPVELPDEAMGLPEHHALADAFELRSRFNWWRSTAMTAEVERLHGVIEATIAERGEARRLAERHFATIERLLAVPNDLLQRTNYTWTVQASLEVDRRMAEIVAAAAIVDGEASE